MIRNSVQNRFFLIAAPIALIGILAVAMWSAKTGHDKQTLRLKNKLEHLIQNQTLVMAEAIRDGDTRLLKLVSAGLVADPDIVFVRIEGSDGQVIASLGQEASTDFILARQINVRKDDELVIGGTLTIGASFDAVRATSFRSLVYSSFGAVLAVLAIWCGGFLAFRHAVGRPIDMLHQMINGWRNDQWTEPAQPKSNDEFGTLTAAFVELHEVIQKRETELESVKEGLERRVAERTKELQERALTDVLTGLPNRRAAVKFAEEWFKQVNHNRCVGIFAIDLDRFKEMNDRFGHAVGDKMLCHAARVIEDHMSPSRLVARMGGDEFIAIIDCTLNAVDKLEGVGDALIKKLSTPVIFDGVECQIGASVGIALAKTTGQDFEALLANADLALYDAKFAGRGRARTFDKNIHMAYRHRRMLVGDVKHAVARREFEPYLQPQIDLTSDTVVGFELLARWRRNPDQLIAPYEFLSAAEDAGLTAELDSSILENGLDALLKLRECGYSDIKLSANASTASLQKPNYAMNVLAELSKRNLRPDDLIIEILEETVITDTNDQAVETIHSLNLAGVGIEMDDFGAGYSSFSQLALLPLNGLKIDRTLIAPIPSGPSVEIIRAILALCKELKLRVVSEGVETAQQLDVLQQLGCDMAQGFLVAEPMPVSDAISWLKEREPLKPASKEAGNMVTAA